MAGADGQRRLWDLSRRAASFLRMARLALTGVAAPAANLGAEEEIGGGGRSSDPCYRSVSTEDDDDWEPDELWLDEDESDLLVDDDDDETRGVSRNITLVGGGPVIKKAQFIGRRPPATSAESSEPLVPRRRAAKRANDAEMAQHPFGCDRRVSESSSLLLVSS